MARRLLAENVRILRLVHGWSQEDLAEAASLDRSYIGGIERAERNVTLDSLEKLAHAFELTIPQLFCEPDPKEIGERLLLQIRQSMLRDTGK